MDGQVIIGTKLDTKDLEKELKSAERQLIQYEKEAEKLTTTKIKLEADVSEYERQKEIIKQGTNERLKLAQTEDQVNFVLGEENIELNDLNSKYSTSFEKLEEINNKIKDNERNQGLVNNRVKQLKNELNKTTGFNSIKSSIDSIGGSIEKNIKKVGRWALAIFGIRSAYMFVRQAMSTLSQYDEQMGVNIEWMRYLLASALKPVIEEIINLAYRLLVYINYIAQAWFGVNLFANASLKAFEKQRKSMGGTVKKAKELQKTIAGFDEMNVLQDNKDTSGGAGANAGKITTPKFEEVKIPKWLEWLGKNGKTILKIVEGIASAIVALKIAKLLKTLGLMGSLPLWQILAGLGLIIFGIIELIKDVIDFLKEPTWEKFGEILTDIGIILAGLAILIGGIPLAVASAVAIIVGLVITNWDKIKSVLLTVAKWISNNVINPVANVFSGLWNKIKTGFQNVWKFITNAFAKGGKIFNGLKDGIVNVFKTIVNALISGINKVIATPFNKINSLLNNIRSTSIMGVKPFKGLWSKNPISVPKIPKLALGGIINMPGRGVPVGGAIAGERGAEGVIPLTDSQQMQLLGEAIGKYITVELTNVTQLDGRQIARKVEQINQNNKFVLNR